MICTWPLIMWGIHLVNIPIPCKLSLTHVELSIVAHLLMSLLLKTRRCYMRRLHHHWFSHRRCSCIICAKIVACLIPKRCLLGWRTNQTKASGARYAHGILARLIVHSGTIRAVLVILACHNVIHRAINSSLLQSLHQALFL